MTASVGRSDPPALSVGPTPTGYVHRYASLLAFFCLPAAALALVVGLELFLLVSIRDNLTLNVWMLFAPDPRILEWQSGA